MNEQETTEREEMEAWMLNYSALTHGSNPMMLEISLWSEENYRVIPIRTETTTLTNPQKEISRENRRCRRGGYGLLGRNPNCYIAPC